MESVITIPSLGRPFKLGMLYDCRNEQLVPAVTLWGPDTLKKSIKKENVTTNFKVSASNNWSEKASMLDIKANVKLSLFCGLIDLKGSAKYLDDKHSTSRTERITLKSKTISHSEELTMEHMAHEKIEYPEVFDHGTATHVVTGIEYGGNAIFVFDRNVSVSNKEKVVEGSAEAVIKKIPLVKLDGKGNLEVTDTDKEIAKSFSCQFYGDCLLHENPSNYEEAVKIYKELPALLSEHGYVPLVVRLYPLSKLDTRASKLIREISTTVAEGIGELLEKLEQIGSGCDDLLLQRRNADIFLSIDQEIQDFKNIVGKYLTSMKSDIAALLPEVRGGTITEKKLQEIIDSNASSPFAIDKLQNWLKKKEEEINILRQYFQHLPGVKVCKSEGEFNALIHKPDVSRVFCLTFGHPSEDHIVRELKAYMKNIKTMLSDEDTATVKSSSEDKKIPSVALIKMFKTFYDIKKGIKEVAFGISVKQTSTNVKGTVIEVYDDGVCVDPEFIPPSIPGMPEILSDKTTHDSVTFKWAPSKFGNIKKYEVFCSSKDFKGEKVEVGSHCKDYTDLKIEGLSPGVEYNITIRAVTDMGPGPISGSSSFKTLPCEPPRKPDIKQVDIVYLHLSWQAPQSIGKNMKIENYFVEVQCAETNKSLSKETMSPDKCFKRVKVKPDGKYRFFVRASCGNNGESSMSVVSEDILVEVKKEDRLKANILGSSKRIEGEETGQRIYHISMTLKRQDESIEKYEYGKRNLISPKEEKVIMMVGATGSGKSTLINGLINYIFGIKWNDPYRLKLIGEAVGADKRSQAVSQTKKITSYTFFHDPDLQYPFTLTLIDTPGFGDTEGVKRDEEITRQMKDFFTTKGTGGIDHLDVVGFVAQSSLARLSVSQKYIFDQVLSLFGQDIAKNIIMLLTFADGNDPQVLSALKAADIPFESYYKFNNSALYTHLDGTSNANQKQGSDSENEDELFDKLFWNMGRSSFKSFLKGLSRIDPCSLQLTKTVMQQREILTVSAEGIRKDIRLGLTKLEKLRTEMEVVRTHEAEIAKSKNFKYFVQEEHASWEKLPPQWYITNCIKCNRTCHDHCAFAKDEDKYRCSAMENDYCINCPGKCHWKEHGNFPHRIVFIRKAVEKTSDDLYTKYKKAGEEKVSALSMLKKIVGQFNKHQYKVLELTEKITSAVNILQQIALKSDPLSTSEYVDIMIENEQRNAEPGWLERVEHLSAVKDRVVYIEECKRSGKEYDPFENYHDVIENVGKYLPAEIALHRSEIQEKMEPGLKGLAMSLFVGKEESNCTIS